MPDLSTMRLLIVEDQLEARSMLRNMLMELGVNQIFEASDGRDALNFLDSAMDLVDMVICDWNMPRMNGVELLRQLRTVNHDIPFLMITGRGDMQSVVEAKGSGVTAYIRKPFSPNQLEVKLRIIHHKVA